MGIDSTWRGDFDDLEINTLHAAAFGTRMFSPTEWPWRALVEDHSLGWVTARTDDGTLVGFVNVVWDGLVHAWLQDTMVLPSLHRQGIGERVVAVAVDHARRAGCEWLHVDFDDDLRAFYFDRCGFSPTTAGLIALQA
ncbi:MAG: GNAT family N-acetyltransferase [Actinomycetota bacterium]